MTLGELLLALHELDVPEDTPVLGVKTVLGEERYSTDVFVGLDKVGNIGASEIQEDIVEGLGESYYFRELGGADDDGIDLAPCFDDHYYADESDVAESDDDLVNRIALLLGVQNGERGLANALGRANGFVVLIGF